MVYLFIHPVFFNTSMLNFTLYGFYFLCWKKKAEMAKCNPPPSRRLSTFAPLIHVMKVCRFYRHFLCSNWSTASICVKPLCLEIGQSFKGKSDNRRWWEEGEEYYWRDRSRVYRCRRKRDCEIRNNLTLIFILFSDNNINIEQMQFSFQVKITAKDLESLEKSKAIINNLTMVPVVGEIYRYLLLVFCSFVFILFNLLCCL